MSARAVPPRAEWDKELVRWFLSEPNLPKAPFEIASGCTVIDDTKFYAGLRLDVEGGPSSPRGVTGAAMADLRALRKLCGT